MNGQDLIQNVALLSNDESNPDSVQTATILKYLNIANDKVLSAVYDLGRVFLSSVVTPTTSSYSTTLPDDFFFLLNVYDTTNNRKLDVKSIEDLEEDNPALDSTGTPTYYYLDGGAIHVYPQQEVGLKIRYIPVLSSITASTEESAIPYPKAYHDVLVAGARYFMSINESAFSDQAERADAKEEYSQRLGQLKKYYKNNGRSAPKTAYQDF